MALKKYIPSEVEPKWQQKWAEDKLYLTDLSKPKDRYYMLVELPYTSGDLHMGHWFTFSMGDIMARMRRAQGYNVLFPVGYDTFGLPAENAAIRNNMHPRDWTYANIERMRKQFKTMGVSIDWEKEVITCEPEYYRWNQWLFLKMLERGVAYQASSPTNWCPSCKTVLADENVEAGKCWRCGTEVIQKEVTQWFFGLTQYADRLIWQDSPSVDWPKPLRQAQNNWIGKSEGIVIKFDDLEVFTTRQDTIFGVSFIVISPEHPLLSKYVMPKNKKEVEKYLAVAGKKSQVERKEEREKTGVFTGSFVKNPVTSKQIPVWIADYVLMGYGTGAVMGVPAHDERDFEFAKKYKLDIPVVIEVEGKPMSKGYQQAVSSAYEGEGVLIDSGEYTGMSTSHAREKISNYIEKHNLGQRKTNYHLHDWSISRQRYWGTPIPIIYCEKCGTVPVPEKDLPVELPYDVDYTPQGKPPLATVEDWVRVKCPKCGGDAEREVETMDGFVDNSWYFYRYLDPHNNKQIFDKKVVGSWIPLNLYIGGAEHTVGHTLYSRFFTKFFHDLCLVTFEEYALKRINHGVILGPDGHRMSKSRGNVVNPDEEAKKYGADAIRIYLMFLGPYDIVTSWNPDGVGGIYHFLQRVWGLQEKIGTRNEELGTRKNRNPSSTNLDLSSLKMMHRTIKKVTDDISELKFNTAIASLMEYLNYLSRKESVSEDEYKVFLKLLAPLAPHMTEELWSMLSEKYSIHLESWPKFDNKYLEDDQVTVIISVNGKMRDTFLVDKDIVSSKEKVEKLAKDQPKVTKFLEGKEIKKTIYVPGKIINLVV